MRLPGLLHSLRSQIAMMLVVQLALFSSIIGFTLYELNLRKHDYVILNLAGQLRVLTQQMANHSLIYAEQHKIQSPEHALHTQVFNENVEKSIGEYDDIIHSFQMRELSPKLTGRNDPLYCSWDKRSLNQLDLTAVTWANMRDELESELRQARQTGEPINAAEYILVHQEELLNVSTNLSTAFRLMMEDKLALISNLNKAAIVLMILTSLGLIALLLKKIFRPLKETINGFKKIAQGNFRHQLPISVQNEIGDMITSFNQLSRRLSGLFELTQRINMATTPPENFAFMADEFESFLPFEWASMLCINAVSKMSLHYQYSHGAMMLPEKNEFDVTEKALLKAVLRQRPVIIPDINALDDNDEFVHSLKNSNLRSMIILPLNLRNMEGAMLLFASIYPGTYTEDHTELMSNIALMLTHSFEKARDIESLVVMRDQAVDISQAKNEFLSNISHEIRTPLTAISGYTDLLLDSMSKEDIDKYSGDIDHIKLSVQHLLNLTGNILDLSKIEANRMELYTEDCPLSMLLDITSVIAQPLMKKNNNRFTCTPPAEAILMHVDHTRFNQILLNLLSNAAKFTSNGEVSLFCERTSIKGQDFINIHVEDTGIGIKQDQMLKLFRDYSQADVRTSSLYGGTGLGLSLSRRLAQLMGGDIFVRSTEGHGSCFTVQLPIAQSNEDFQHAEIA